MSDYSVELTKQLSNSHKEGIKEFLGYLYKLVEVELKGASSILEIGAGAGISKIFLPQLNILRTDIFSFKENGVEGGVNSHFLSFETDSFYSGLAIDVMHHLECPLVALEELKRVCNLAQGGRIILVEPYVSIISYPIYRIFHKEKTSNPWSRNYSEPFVGTKPEDGDQALSKLLFSKKQGRNLLANHFPPQKYRIKIRIFSVLSFFSTGGLNNPLPTSKVLIRFILLIERLIPQVLLRIIGSRCIIVIEEI